MCGGQRGRGDSARGHAGRAAAGSVLRERRGKCKWRGNRSASAARAATGQPAGIHGAGRLCEAGASAADTERQAGPQGLAGPGGPSVCEQGLRGPARRGGTDARGDLANAAGRGARGSPRRLLHAGRSLAAGRAAGGAGAHAVGRGAGADGAVRPAKPERGGTSDRARTGPRTAGDHGGRSQWTAAAVVRAAAIVVPGADGGGQRGVSHPGGAEAEGRAGRGSIAPRTGPDRGAARSAAHVLRGAGRASGTARGIGRRGVDAGLGRPERGGSIRAPARLAGRGGGESPVRPGARPTDPRPPGKAGRAGTRAADHDAPHRVGRVVAGRAGSRIGRTVRGLPCRQRRSAAGLADPIRGLRSLAAPMAGERGTAKAGCVLGTGTGRRPDAAGPSNRPGAATTAGLCRRFGRSGIRCGTEHRA
ncbi:hypothetical protein GO299_04853 [Ralstonia solanacearum]|nr:hypothetical protein [Ralstonia solanacearum]NKF57681.1 hypothetical protein [Ralstonia solanacearum]NKF72556.1 hypothetical protein [Ralstonia solanacearum]